MRKKRLLSLLLVLVMVLTLLPGAALAQTTDATLLQADPAQLSLAEQLKRQLLLASAQTEGFSLQALGDTAETTFYIVNADQLKELATFVNAGDAAFVSAHYELVADIDLSAVCGANVGGNEVSWTPIGATEIHPFKGIFDGKEHVVSNLYINANSTDIFYGLFGYTENCTIKNVKAAVNISVTESEAIAGGLAANAANSTIQNCHSSGMVSVDGNWKRCFIGGVVGQQAASAIMTNNVALNPSVSGGASSGVNAVEHTPRPRTTTWAGCRSR